MDVSVSITNYPVDLKGLGHAADDCGLHTLWVADHLIQADPAAKPTDPMLEAYSVLNHLAAVTSRIRLGAMVSPVTFRAPSVLIKTVTTLDVLSGGRAWLGLGAGYEAGEAEAAGLPLPPMGERFDLLEQTLREAISTWAGDGPLSHPAPIKRPPILIGGAGEKRTLRLVAEYADACNVFDIPDGGVTIRRKLDVLRGHCEAAGRDFAGITKTVATALRDGEPAEAFAARCADLRSYGLEHVVVITRGRPLTPRDVELVGQAPGLIS
ncbi:LLM class flavin-dependent oxidoreductase [Actinoplanes sp. NPDC049596]|uniref:LLM class flavin-dependent oxidoreductase n=1 Tax=unclassified Actinoplanes TaxID=2626549 RepID=UPI0034493066